MRQLTEFYDREYRQPVMRPLRCTVKWGIINTIATENASADSDDTAPFSNISGSTLFNNQYPNTQYGTFEPYFWDLTGAVKLVPSNGNYGETGWITSSMCDSAGNFDLPYPAITINFAIPVNLAGLLVNFSQSSKEFAREFDVVVRFASDPESTVNITNNEAFSTAIPLTFEDVVSLDIVLVKWNRGERRGKIVELEFGLYKYYTNDTLMNVEENKMINQVGTELPISTINVTVLDKENQFDRDNPSGLTPYLTQRQPVEVSYEQLTDNGWEQIVGGTYYLKEWSDTGKRFEYMLMSEDLLGFMDTPYYGGRYYQGGVDVKVEMERVLSTAFPIVSGLNGYWDLSHVPDGLIYAPIPIRINVRQVTCKDALQMLAQYANCIVQTDERGYIVPKPLEYTVATQESMDSNYIIEMSKVYDTPPKARLKSTLRGVDSVLREIGTISGATQVYSITILGAVAGRPYICEHTISNMEQPVDYTKTTVTVTNLSSTPITAYTADKNSYATLITFDNDGDYIVSISSEILTINKASVTVLNVGDASYQSGETVVLDNYTVSDRNKAQELADAFIRELELREEYEIKIKRDLRPETANIVELAKMNPATGLPLSNVNTRVLSIKRNLTSASQSVKLREVVLDDLP